MLSAYWPTVLCYHWTLYLFQPRINPSANKEVLIRHLGHWLLGASDRSSKTYPDVSRSCTQIVRMQPLTFDNLKVRAVGGSKVQLDVHNVFEYHASTSNTMSHRAIYTHSRCEWAKGLCPVQSPSFARAAWALSGSSVRFGAPFGVAPWTWTWRQVLTSS